MTLSNGVEGDVRRGDLQLAGQTVVVLGGSSGIGLETARRARAKPGLKARSGYSRTPAAVRENLSPRYRPMVIFAAATGLRPAEWLGLEWRDVDLEARVAYVHRSFAKGRLKCPKTEASRRGPAPDDRARRDRPTVAESAEPTRVPRPAGRLPRLHNFRNREWKPAQIAAGIEPLRRVYDLRHTFATFALRAGISTFDLSRYMGASLTMIDWHYGHLARAGREHAIRLLDELSAGQRPRWTLVDAAWTPTPTARAGTDKGTTG